MQTTLDWYGIEHNRNEQNGSVENYPQTPYTVLLVYAMAI